MRMCELGACYASVFLNLNINCTYLFSHLPWYYCHLSKTTASFSMGWAAFMCISPNVKEEGAMKEDTGTQDTPYTEVSALIWSWTKYTLTDLFASPYCTLCCGRSWISSCLSLVTAPVVTLPCRILWWSSWSYAWTTCGNQRDMSSLLTSTNLWSPSLKREGILR